MQPTAPATNSGQALTNLQQFQQGMQTPGQETQAADQSLGVQGAQQTVQGLQGAINNTTNLLNQVVPTVQGNTQNSLVTSSQAGQQETNAEAPLQSTLTDQTNKYDQANSNYQDLETQAENKANADETGQQNQLSYLQNVYNDLYTQEQASQAAQTQQSQFAQQMAEQAREANLSSSSTNSASNLLSGLLGGSGSSGQGSATASYKNGTNGSGGFDFTDSGGKAISAATYAQQTGTPIGTVLQKLGSEGDTYAQQAYNKIKNNQAYYNSNPNALKSEFSALFWGS